jgi:hypothetical protein
MNELIGIKKNEDIRDIDGPRDEDVDLYEKDDGPGPTLDPMRPYFTTIKCEWNNCLAEQFVRHVIEVYEHLEFDEEDMMELEEVFWDRMQYLKREFSPKVIGRGKNSPNAVFNHKMEKLNRQRPNTRRLTVSHKFILQKNQN